MNIDCLRVMNAIYRLRITEKEFENIDREQKEDNTGLYIACMKKGYCVCVSHDDKHKIIIKKIDKEYAPSRVLFKTITKLVDLPKEIYILHSIAQYRAGDYDIKHSAKDLDELKDRICDRFVDKYPKSLGDKIDDEYCSYDDREKLRKKKAELVDMQLRALFWLFDENYEKFKNEVKVARPNVPRIIKAFQRNNRRLAIIQENKDYDKKRGGWYGWSRWIEHIEKTAFKIRTYTPKSRCYNYCCAGREVWLPNDYHEKGEIWLDDDLFEKISPEELKILSRNMQYLDEGETERPWVLLTADDFNKKQQAIRIEVMNAQRKMQEDNARKKLAENINQQFEEGKVVRNGIIITKEGMEYEGVKFKGSKFGEYAIQEQIHLQTEPEFHKIIEGYICYVLCIDVKRNYYYDTVGFYVNFKGKEKMQIGGIKICVEFDEHNKSIFINNHRIVKDDVKDVLLKAMQYDTQEGYDNYLKYTSRVNLRLQRAIDDGGISFELKIDKTDDNELQKYEGKILLSIPVRRDNGKTYCKVGDKEYRVKSHNALFDISEDIDDSHLRDGHIQRAIKLLYRALDGISHKEIGKIITDGENNFKELQERIRKENEVKVKKSEEFLENAVKLSNAVKIKEGYKVKGVSGTSYTVNKESLAVYKVGKKEEYLCIVDMKTDTSTEWGRNDAVAKRLLMLSKDIKVAPEVNTLGDHMDRHWEEIEA